MRDEAPLYYNEAYDFYTVTRHSDVKAGLANHQSFSSARGDILEMIKQDAPMPPGTFICEDPPMHSVHRAIVQRINQEMTPCDRDGTVEDIANTVFFLASDEGSYINGQSIALDGGWSTTKFLCEDAMMAERV